MATTQGTSVPPSQSPGVGVPTLVTVDIMVLVVYFLLVLAVGLWSMWKPSGALWMDTFWQERACPGGRWAPLCLPVMWVAATSWAWQAQERQRASVLWHMRDNDGAAPGLAFSAHLYCFRGLLMAVMIAALMSSLTSTFTFTMDLWRHIRSRATEMFVLVLVVVQAGQGGQLFIYSQSISTFLQPPVSIIFLTGCFWKRTNEKGAFWGLCLGLLVGGVRMDFIYLSPLCYQEDSRPDVVKHIHYFSTMLSLLTLATEKPSPEQVRGGWGVQRDHNY